VSAVRGERAIKGQTKDVPDEHVEGEEDDEDEAREEGGREQRAPLPLLAFERLVQPCRREPCKRPHEHEQQQHPDHDRTAVRRAQEPHGGEDDEEKRAKDKLHARPNDDAEKHGHIGGGAEDVGVHQLPPGFFPFLLLFLVRQHLVSSVGGRSGEWVE
jgi:hypothetical protein